MGKDADSQGGRHDDPAAGGFRWRSFLAHLASFVVVALLAVVIVGIAIGVRPLEESAARTTGAHAPTIEIVWPARADGGTWLPVQFQEELRAKATAALGPTPEAFSSAPLRRIAEAMERSGWFEGAPTVERTDAARIVVRGAWRIPAAVVRTGGKDYLVSWRGMRMPPVYELGQSGLPVIESPTLPPPTRSDATPEYAVAWPGEDIAASLELLREISDKRWAAQVRGVDASRFAAESTLTILTTFGTRVEWGGRFSKPRLGEPPTSEKLDRLAFLFRDRGRIDAGFPVVELWQRHLLFDRSATAGLAASGEQPADEPKESQPGVDVPSRVVRPGEGNRAQM
jgi:hypothetical protein